jgi:hypothetical protein
MVSVLKHETVFENASLLQTHGVWTEIALKAIGVGALAVHRRSIRYLQSSPRLFPIRLVILVVVVVEILLDSTFDMVDLVLRA